jgi:hypothetical protein
MLDTQQLREIMGENEINKLKNHNKRRATNRRYGRFPSDGNEWGYGFGANLVNWNYDASNGQAVNPTIIIDERYQHT